MNHSELAHLPCWPEWFVCIDCVAICSSALTGIGKSTLLQVIYQVDIDSSFDIILLIYPRQELEPTSGLVTRNPRLRVSRFSQHHVDHLTMKHSALEQASDSLDDVWR